MGMRSYVEVEVFLFFFLVLWWEMVLCSAIMCNFKLLYSLLSSEFVVLVSFLYWRLLAHDIICILRILYSHRWIVLYAYATLILVQCNFLSVRILHKFKILVRIWWQNVHNNELIGLALFTFVFQISILFHYISATWRSIIIFICIFWALISLIYKTYLSIS